jgi:plastocyanin
VLTRRRFTSGIVLAGLAAPVSAPALPVVEIRMRSDEEGSQVGFDPIGLLLQPGQTVRWRCEANYHTTTAYHPANDSRSLRIPRGASPWASDILAPGDTFEVTLTVEGVYDYCCAPHEEAGMVGRLIVGHATGPGSLPFDWFKNTNEGRGWHDVPPEAQAAFPRIAEIMARRVVPAKKFQSSNLEIPGAALCAYAGVREGARLGARVAPASFLVRTGM